MASIFDRSRNRWHEILTSPAIGISEEVLNGRHHTCPGCGGKDRFRYKRDADGGYFCGNNRANGLDLVMHVKGCGYREACELVEIVVGKDYEPPKERVKTFSEMLLEKARTLRKSAYLESRGLVVPPGLQCVRDLQYTRGDGSKTRYNAILGQIRVAGEFRAYHATYLKNGQKAPESPARKVLPGKPINGGAIELWPLEGDTLGVAEGIESAIAAHLTDQSFPVWSTISATGMETFRIPKRVKNLVIFGDNDKSLTGHAAAYRLARNATLAGVAVKIIMPSERGADMNDVLLDGLGVDILYTT